MPNWKKLIVSGSSAELTTLKLTGLSGQSSEATSLMINGSGVIGTRELGSNAFNSTSFATGDNFDEDGTFASLRAQGTTKGDVGLGNVENTALSTYTGDGGALDNQYITNGANYVTAGVTLTTAAQPNITSLGTLTSLNAGRVTVDDIDINGSTIADTGDLTLDVGGDLTIDVDGADILLKDGGTEFGRFSRVTSDFVIRSITQDKDLLFKGNDGGSTITALSLDMSAAGTATFNNDIEMGSAKKIRWGTGDAQIAEGISENYALEFSTYNGSSMTEALRLSGDNSATFYGAATFSSGIADAGTISAGTWNGTDIAVADGGTGASNASDARTNLGLGALATLGSISNSNWSGADLAVANGGTGASDASGARSNLGLGALATLGSISNSNWSGTDLAVANGGTGASTASGARSNLGLGSAATKAQTDFLPGNEDGYVILDSTDGTATSAATLNYDGGIFYVGSTSTSNSEVRVLSSDTTQATISAYGSTQGTGRLYVGQSSTYGGGVLYNGDDNPDITSTTDKISHYRRNAGTDTEVFYYSYDSNTVNFKGDVVAFASSDERLKTNIKPIENTLDKIDRIGGYNFDWVPQEGIHENEGSDIGVIAQEIEKEFPELVTTREDGYKAVKYDKLSAVLLQAVKDLRKELNGLKSKS